MSEQIYDLDGLKPLTSNQYDGCKTKAIDRLKKRVGDKPTRKQFKREYSPLVTVLDYVALVVFIAALAVSSTHIMQLAAQEAAASYKLIQTGWQFDQNTYTVIHQLGLIALAEASAILFLVMHNLTAGNRASRPVWLRPVGLFGFMAVCSAAFVFAANLVSGLHPFIAVLPPLFTLGVGYRLETIITELLRRQREIDTAYQQALDAWTVAQSDIQKHPEFKALFAQELWQALTSGAKSRTPYKDAPAGFRVAAVKREMQRDSWAYDLDGLPTVTSYKEGGEETENPTTAATAPQYTNGHHVEPVPIRMNGAGSN